MALFKSEAERRTERNLQVKRALREIQKNIQRNDEMLESFKKKAVRANQIGDKAQLNVIRGAMKQTFALKRTQERQILAIEVAMQIKDQAESVNAFAEAMRAVSRAIGATFAKVDVASGIQDYEKAMGKANTLSEQMDLFLDAASGTSVSDVSSEGISDAEIDGFIEDATIESETSLVDDRVSAGLERARKELQR